MTRPREYTIEYDRDGYYLAYEGWDLCRTYRFGSFKDAKARRVQWEKEDEEAMSDDMNDHAVMAVVMATKAVHDGIDELIRIAGENEQNYRIVQCETKELNEIAGKLGRLLLALSRPNNLRVVK